jgi:aspartate racemase
MATVDFLKKLVEQTPAECDEDHLPVVVYSVPQMPSRNAAIMKNGKSPLPEMLAGLRALRTQGAQLVAIPCNTAHFWYDEMCREGGLPIVHIVDAVCEQVEKSHDIHGPIGLLSTEATLAARIYHDRMSRRGIGMVVNCQEERDKYVTPAIDLVKRGHLTQAGDLVAMAVENLLERGAKTVILGCTELPVALDSIAYPQRYFCVDATRALAEATVSRALG